MSMCFHSLSFSDKGHSLKFEVCVWGATPAKDENSCPEYYLLHRGALSSRCSITNIAVETRFSLFTIELFNRPPLPNLNSNMLCHKDYSLEIPRRGACIVFSRSFSRENVPVYSIEVTEKGTIGR